jgi:predicted enzyme involved in methoxymalonyl-ACP biosynthesis
MITIVDAIKAINSNAEMVVRGEDIDDCQIEWHNGTSEISKVDIKTKISELETAYDNNAYQRDRATEYPSIPEQLDDIYHNGVDEWKKTIKAVKDKYPKE